MKYYRQVNLTAQMLTCNTEYNLPAREDDRTPTPFDYNPIIEISHV